MFEVDYLIAQLLEIWIMLFSGIANAVPTWGWALFGLMAIAKFVSYKLR